MAEPVEIRERVTRLESALAEVRYLASRVTREGAEFAAMISGRSGAVDALRETQLEQTNMLAGLESKIAERFFEVRVEFWRVREHVGWGRAEVIELREGFERMTAALDVLEAGQQRITELLAARPRELCGCET